MDYKEKYEMALEGIQEILGSGADSIKMSRLQLRLQGIFPELKESEDDRIRKAIIECVKNYGPSSANPQLFKNMIAWLEKQGEKESDPRYENLEEILAADDIYQMSMNDEMVQEAKEKAVNALSGMCIGRLLGLEKQYVQKPAWSEEDEENLKGIIWEIKANKCSAPSYDIANYDRFLSWLKSIKDRMQL